jgi:hypothetical protein
MVRVYAVKTCCSRTCALGYLQVRALVSSMPIVMNVLVVKLRSGCTTKGGGILWAAIRTWQECKLETGMSVRHLVYQPYLTTLVASLLEWIILWNYFEKFCHFFTRSIVSFYSKDYSVNDINGNGRQAFWRIIRNALAGKNVPFFNVTQCGTHSNRWTSKVSHKFHYNLYLYF